MQSPKSHWQTSDLTSQHHTATLNSQGLVPPGPCTIQHLETAATTVYSTCSPTGKFYTSGLIGKGIHGKDGGGEGGSQKDEEDVPFTGLLLPSLACALAEVIAASGS